MRFVAGKGVVAERHREDAGRAPWQLRCCWQDAAGRGAVAERHREAAVGRGRYSGAVAGRAIATEHFPCVNEIFCPFGCHQFTLFLNFAAVSALRL